MWHEKKGSCWQALILALIINLSVAVLRHCHSHGQLLSAVKSRRALGYDCCAYSAPLFTCNIILCWFALKQSVPQCLLNVSIGVSFCVRYRFHLLCCSLIVCLQCCVLHRTWEIGYYFVICWEYKKVCLHVLGGPDWDIICCRGINIICLTCTWLCFCFDYRWSGMDLEIC